MWEVEGCRFLQRPLIVISYSTEAVKKSVEFQLTNTIHAISSRFRNYLLDVCNKRTVAIGLERDRYLGVVCLRSRFAFATSRRLGKLPFSLFTALFAGLLLPPIYKHVSPTTKSKMKPKVRIRLDTIVTSRKGNLSYPELLEKINQEPKRLRPKYQQDPKNLEMEEKLN